MPDKKRYFELVAAILSIPVLITVILLNTNILRGEKKDDLPTTPTIIETQKVQVITQPPQQIVVQQSQPESKLPKTNCIEGVGPVDILSPRNGEELRANPVCLQINTDKDYCPVLFSSSLDGSDFSEYSSDGVCFYNLEAGEHDATVRIKSTITDEVVSLGRSFVIEDNVQGVATGTPVPVVKESPSN